MADDTTPLLSEMLPELDALRVFEAVHREAEACAAPDPFAFMTLHQAYLFQHLVHVPTGLPIATLVERSHTSYAAVSQMLTRMENRGVIARRPHPRDSRCRLIVPTDKGYANYRMVVSAAKNAASHWLTQVERHATYSYPVRRSRPTFGDYAAGGSDWWRQSRTNFQGSAFQSGGLPDPVLYGAGWRAS